MHSSCVLTCLFQTLLIVSLPLQENTALTLLLSIIDMNWAKLLCKVTHNHNENRSALLFFHVLRVNFSHFRMFTPELLGLSLVERTAYEISDIVIDKLGLSMQQNMIDPFSISSTHL